MYVASRATDTSYVAGTLTERSLSRACVACPAHPPTAAIPVGHLVKLHGCRPLALVGGCLTGVGLLASSFMPSLYWLYASYGVVVGAGFSFSFAPSVAIVSQYVRAAVLNKSLPSVCAFDSVQSSLVCMCCDIDRHTVRQASKPCHRCVRDLHLSRVCAGVGIPGG